MSALGRQQGTERCWLTRPLFVYTHTYTAYTDVYLYLYLYIHTAQRIDIGEEARHEDAWPPTTNIITIVSTSLAVASEEE